MAVVRAHEVGLESIFVQQAISRLRQGDLAALNDRKQAAAGCRVEAECIISQLMDFPAALLGPRSYEVLEQRSKVIHELKELQGLLAQV